MSRLPELNSILKNLPREVDTSIELYQSDTTSRQTSWSDGRPYLQEYSDASRASLRLLKNNQEALLSVNQFSVDRIPSLIEQAFDIAAHSPPDVHRVLGRTSSSYPKAPAIDQTLFQQPLDTLLQRLANVEKKILASDSRIKKVVRMGFYENRTVETLANTNGVSLSKEGSHAAFSIEILAGDEQNTEASWDYRADRFFKNLDIEDIAEEAARHAVLSLGGTPLPSGRYTLVVHPRVGSQLLSLFTNALSAEAVHLSRSFLKGKLEERIASPVVSMIDDPFLENGVASGPFDDEGTPHQRIDVVSEGILKSLFYDLRSAHRGGRESNGHGMRSGALAKPAPTNFYMAPGRKSVADLLAASPKVFELRDVMGLHMADPITGEFSLGASGYLYEKGSMVRPVRGVTIGSQVGNFLKNVRAIASDLTWYGAIGAPSFLVEDVTVAGT